jgi:hypothetical protein
MPAVACGSIGPPFGRVVGVARASCGGIGSRAPLSSRAIPGVAGDKTRAGVVDPVRACTFECLEPCFRARDDAGRGGACDEIPNHAYVECEI